jgi:predicted RNA-binding Zn-ribbon protein involved in translation (DUF1610 family)
MDCKHCSAAMEQLEAKPGFEAFHCPSCDFVIIESVRHDAQEGRAVSSGDRSGLALPDCVACGWKPGDAVPDYPCVLPRFEPLLAPSFSVLG